MSFYRKYELERLVQKAEPKTFRAREVGTGRTVYLHMLGGLDAASRKPLLDKSQALLAAHSPAVVDVDDSAFAPYVVTPVVEDFAGFPGWLAAIPITRAAPPPAAPSVPLSPEAVDTKTIEMSALFPASAQLRPGPMPSPAAQPASAPPPSAPPPSAPPPAQFRPATPAPAVPGPSPMPAASSAAEPGEFTKMFGGGAQAPAPPAPPAQTPRLAPAASAPMPSAGAPMMPPAAAMPPAAGSPGDSEFSRVFGSSNPPAAPPASSDAGEFTRMFGAPPAAPRDNPAGFSPVMPPKPQPEAPLPWEPRADAPAPPPLPAAQPVYPLVETPDTQKQQAATRPPLPVPPMPLPAQQPIPQQPAAYEGSGSMWNSPAPPLPGQQPIPQQPAAYEGSASMWNSPPPADAGGGEFTKFFGSPMAAGSLPIEEIERGRMPEAQAPADKPFGGPGEFTRFFGSTRPGENPPPPQTPAQFATYSGRATGLFNAPMAGAQPGATPIAPAQGPSEFTRQMNRADLMPGEPVAFVPGSTAKPGRGALIGIIIAIVLVLLLLGATLILMVRH